LPKRAEAAQRREQRSISARLGAIVDALRGERELTEEQLAGRSQLSVRKLRNLKKDHVDPSLTTVLRLCRGLDVSVDTLLGGLPLPETPRPLRDRRTRGRKPKPRRDTNRATK
jgi:transcriptional regulator with XRE-family HTH domain